MIPRSWRRTLTPSPNPRRVVRRRFRPVLEILEDRMAPAVLTVNSTADTAQATDPYLSLHEAIAIVNSPTLPTGLSSQILASDSSPIGITAGPDGNLWFTEFTGNKVGKITPAGAITEFPIPTASSFPYGITAGPDGNLWFVEDGGNKIGRITPAGTITEFPSRRPAAARRDHGGPGRQPLVYGKLRQQDRPDHLGRHRHRIRDSHAQQLPPGDHGGPGRQPLVHRRPTATRSARSPRSAPSPSSPFRRPAVSPTVSRRARTATSGSWKVSATRSAGSSVGH